MSVYKLLDDLSIPSGPPNQSLLWDIWTQRHEKLLWRE